MLRAKILLFLFFIAFSQHLFSQEGYQPGYIVNFNNDTIIGFIEGKVDSKLSAEVNFKGKKELESGRKYTANNILGFGFDNGRDFQSMQLQDVKNLDENHVFAKKIIEGKIDLFLWRTENESKPNFFLTNNETGETVLLRAPVKKNLKNESGREYNYIDKNYLNYLQNIKNEGEISSKDEIRYSEKRIKNDVFEFNRRYESEYPVSSYQEKIEYSHDVIVGVPLYLSSDGMAFRVAVYRNKKRTEKSSSFSIIRGISYQHWSNKDKIIDENFDTGTSNYRWHSLSIIPIGIKYQGNDRILQPYAYVGVGLGVLALTDYVIENFENKGSKTTFSPFPTINLGAGVRIKVGSKFILLEITPSVNAAFINAGISF